MNYDTMLGCVITPPNISFFLKLMLLYLFISDLFIPQFFIFIKLQFFMIEKYYKLIWDENVVKEWCNRVLKPLKKDEVYVIMLVARRKYSPVPIHYKNEFINHQYIKEGTAEEVIQKIRRWECKFGAWMDRKTGNLIPNEALCVYVDANPKSTIRGVKGFLNEMLNTLFELGSNPEHVYRQFKRCYVRLYANIVKANSRKNYILIDIDSKDQKLFNEVIDLLSPVKDSLVIGVETRGGYHFLYDLHKNKENNKYLFAKIKPEIHKKYLTVDEKSNKKLLVEIKPQALTIVAGTLQGGFQTRIIYP